MINKNIKILTKLTLVLTVLLFLLFPFYNTLAQEEGSNETGEKEIPVNLKIPKLTKPCDENGKFAGSYCVNNFGEYIIQFYQWFARAAGIFAAVMIVFAGFQWITASGNATKIEKAKATLNGALIGLVLTLGAFVLLNTINPALVRFKLLPLSNISKNVLDTFYCRGFPDKESIDNYPHFACGTSYDIPKSVQDEVGYGESYCCGSVCSDVDEEGNPQICANDVTMVGEDCPLNCFDPQKLCEEANKDECYKIDDILEKNKITDYKCSKDRPGLSFDSCAYVEIVENPCEGNWKRINCSFKGEYSGEVETACWDKDEPRDYCTNDERVGDIDKWCCALFPKENIFCQEEKPYSSMGDVWEEKDIIQIDCDSDILDNGESYNSMSGTYYDNTTENCSSNCWMRTNLLWKN